MKKINFNNKLKNNRVSRGFTLVELMVTITVAAILLTIAIPSLTQMIQDNRMATGINAIPSSLAFARSEAVTKGVNVSLCTRNTAGTGCDATKNWEDGWIIFRDMNGNGAFNDDGDTDLCEDGEDCILRVKKPLGNSMTLRSSGTIGKFITFNSRGLAQHTGVFRLCDDRGASKARGIKITLTNTSKRLTDTNGDGINDDAGVNLTCP